MKNMSKFFLAYVLMAFTYIVFWIFYDGIHFLILSMTCVIAGLLCMYFDRFLKKLQELSDKMEDMK